MVAFSELLARSCFSFLRGASHPEELVERSHQLGLAALALCDRNGLYGAPRAFLRARQLGLPLIVGAELTLADRSDPLWERSSPRSRADRRQGLRQREPAVVVLLALDHVGYTNLCRLLTRAHAQRAKGEAQCEPGWLGEHAAGLFAVIPAPLTPGGGDTPSPALLGEVREAFGERAALAIYRYLDEFDAARLAFVEAGSARYGIPIVASARPLFHVRERKPLADVVACIRLGLTLDTAGTRLRGNAEAVLRGPGVMARLFRDHPEWLERSGEIASRCRFSLAELTYEFPCALAPGETANARLRRLVGEGGERRYPWGVPAAVQAQLEKELALIARLGKAPYFLSAWEIVEIARRRRILCQGRGSAANSAVCYVLGITAVDPARSNLLFERFMSEERDEPPDIDIDFEHERREEVIQELYARYGRDRAAMVAEIIAYRSRSALREVGKVFGLASDQIAGLSQLAEPWGGLDETPQRLAEIGLDPRADRVRQVLEHAAALRGFPRHLSIHVGGFVLSARPLVEVAPIEPARMAGRTVIPWDKDDIEALGFFKVDILGLGMLTAIRKCLASIHAEGGLRQRREGGPRAASAATEATREGFDPIEVLARIPAEDPAVYRLVSRADTVGVFQIESRAQMAMLPRLRPNCFYDLVIEVALVRPGPIQGGMVHPYLRRRQGLEAALSPHPSLEPILARTLGIPLFQEQVIELAMVGAGYTAGEADRLRRDMAAWKQHGRLLRHRERLLTGFSRQGVPPRFAAALFEQIQGFGEYGFPESHAASFALLVYASAWQKAHFPAHFVCALLNSQPMGFYSVSGLVQDAQRHGVKVRDVCVLSSDWDASLEPMGAESQVDEAPGVRASWPAVRLGLRSVKGLGEVTGRRLLAARAARRFDSLEDLLCRSGISREALEALAEAGALEALVPGRRQALWRLRAPRSSGLFAGIEPREPEVKLPPLGAAEQLVLDYGRKGLSVHDHPLWHLRTALTRRGVVRATELARRHRGAAVVVAGLVTCRQQPMTAGGVLFLTLEDETGMMNLVVWPAVYRQFQGLLRRATMLLAEGKLERDGGTAVTEPKGDVLHVIVRRLESLTFEAGTVRAPVRDFC